MTEELAGEEPQVPSHHIMVYTPENIQDLGYDSHLLDALSLLRQGIHELRDEDGIHSANEWKSSYSLVVENDSNTTRIALWEYMKEQQKLVEARKELSKAEMVEKKRYPFLLVEWNTKDGIIGVLEGRRYIYEPTGDPAIFINWVVVRDYGSNDTDTYTYRGRHVVADSLYSKVEEMARQNGVKLIIAGVNSKNKSSQTFHEKRGFVNESTDKEDNPQPYATDSGAFIPPFAINDIDSQGNKIVDKDSNGKETVRNTEFFTKRLK